MLSAISYLIELEFGIYGNQDLPNGLQHKKLNQTITKYAVIWSQNVYFVTTLYRFIYLTETLDRHFSL